MKKLRVAIIGIAHIHVDYMLYFFGLHKDMYEIVGCADYPPYTKEDFELHKECKSALELYGFRRLS